MSEFHYTSNGQQLGPVTAAELKMLAKTGQLQPTDMIWKDGMADWVPATRVKGLFGGDAGAPPVIEAVAPPPQQYARPAQGQGYVPPAAAQYPGAQIAYYNPSQLGARTAQILKGHPIPTGPQAEWPLSDSHLAQLALAEKHRKTIRNGASLLNFLVLMHTLGAIGLGIAALLALGEGRNSRVATVASGMMLAVAIGCVAFAVLSQLAKSATLRCRTWGVITFIVLYSIGVVLNLVGLAATVTSPTRNPGEQMVFTVVILLFAGAFILVFAKAAAAIPRFRASPVWAQEALVNAKL